MSDAPGHAAFPDDVDVAIVSHNGRDTLPEVLASLARAGAPMDRVLLCDIGSSDGTADWMAQAWPAVAVRRLDGNVGPNPARNEALRQATRPYLLLLDSDAFIEPDLPARLRAAAADAPGAGLIAPVVVHAQQPDRIQYASVSLHFLCEAVGPLKDQPLAARGTDRREIGSAAGVALLVPVAVARAIGLFDERYFMGKDDGDFCYRLRLAGHPIIEEPRAIVRHGSKPRSAWMLRFQIRNRWYFMLKNYEARTLAVLAPALCLHEPLLFAMLAAGGHTGAWVQALRDLWRWRPAIGEMRHAVQSTRRVHDRALLVSAPLIVRDDLAAGASKGRLKRLYEAWLDAYWHIARPLLS